MNGITNPKIEQRLAEIGKTKAKIAELQAKLRKQEKRLRDLEDVEIVARFRSERMSDERLGALRSRKSTDILPHTDTDVSGKPAKEETRNANTEN
jgi:hypothetical protein